MDIINYRPSSIKPHQDIKGVVFGRLTAQSFLGTGVKNGKPYWRCICSCGNVVEVSVYSLLSGHTSSCGCLQRDITAERLTIHGLHGTPEHSVYNSMLQRCYDEKSIAYKSYGGRGIKVCDRWKDPQLFQDDMGPRPEGMTLERKDVNKDYSPDNCVWASKKDQARNRRNNVIVEFNGKVACMSEHAEDHALSASTVGRRIKRGWSIEKALLTKSTKRGF